MTEFALATARVPAGPWQDFNDATYVPPAPHDKDELRSRMLQQLEAVLTYLLPHGRIKGKRFVVGNVRGEPGDSLVVELEGDKRGVWFDFATGERGDILALWAAVHQFTLPGEFPALLDEVACWLAVPRSDVRTDNRRRGHGVPNVAFDTLGPATGRWRYLSADGQLLACVYRYDTPHGKEYRPRDVLSGAHRMPDPRPLYNLPGIATSNTVVLVEGEKCAEALIGQCICATTAMGGASAPLGKTDWTPLAGKLVIVWPDHDEAGRRYAESVTAHLLQLGMKVHQVQVPDGKPEKWDAADAVAEQMNVAGLLAGARPVPPTMGSGVALVAERLDLQQWHAVDRFAGEPPVRQWLVEGVFPLGQASLVAAAGGVGKSFLLLALARDVAAGRPQPLATSFGAKLFGGGQAVYLTAEDDKIEVQTRLQALGPLPHRLYPVPLVDAGGAVPLFAPDATTRGPSCTGAWHDLTAQLIQMSDLRLIVLDPLQPLCALDLNVPENAQHVCSQLSALAARTGASVIVSHHFAKREAFTPEQAREAIRGTGGLVDGVRSVYALWHPKEDEAKAVCAALDVPYLRASVVLGGVVKANGRADLKITTYVRDMRGLLVDRTLQVACGRSAQQDLHVDLKLAIARGAQEGKPYTKTGGNGVYERRHELPEVFHSAGKHRLAALVDDLLARGDLVQAMMQGSRQVKWLDLPDGPVALGQGEFVLGHLNRNRSGRHSVA